MKSLFIAVFVVLIAAVPTVASARIACSRQLSHTAFFNRLKPGPDTVEARRHLKRAWRARTETECLSELRAANFYAMKAMGEYR